MDCQWVELNGVRYGIVPESILRMLAEQAGVKLTEPASVATQASIPVDLALDRANLAQRLIDRRRRTGLSQAELARQAGVRVETLNRVERGKTTPDFSTVRKLVVAMNEAEAREAESTLTRAQSKETNHVRTDESR